MVSNVSFSENFVYLANGSSLLKSEFKAESQSSDTCSKSELKSLEQYKLARTCFKPS